MRALVIDDSLMARKILSDMLVELGFETIEAASGSEGWEHLTGPDPVDIVFLDLYMPQMNGFAFIEKLRGDPNPDLRALPLIVITSDSDLDSAQKVLELGAQEFILKPTSKESVREKLDLIGMWDRNKDG